MLRKKCRNGQENALLIKNRVILVASNDLLTNQFILDCFTQFIMRRL